MIRMKLEIDTIIKNSKTKTLLIIYFVMIFCFAGAFFLLSYTNNHGIYKSSGGKISLNASGLFDSLYFSFVTSTSLGYGDIKPIGISRLFAIIEVVVSLIIFGLLISKLLYSKQDKILEELYVVSFQERFTRITSGLYNFRAEIDRIMGKVDAIKKKEDLEEIMQNIEFNLHALANNLADSEKIDSEFRKNIKMVADVKEDILLDNVHNSIAKLEELISILKSKNIGLNRKNIMDNLKIILNSTENICKKCVDLEFKNIKEIIDEVKRHSIKIKTEI